MSYPLAYRRRVFETKAKKGLTFEETSELFGISIRTLFRWQTRLEPVTNRKRRATKIDMDALRKDVEKHPDAYQHERAERLGVSPRCIGYALQRLGISRKKNSTASQSGRRITYHIPRNN